MWLMNPCLSLGEISSTSWLLSNLIASLSSDAPADAKKLCEGFMLFICRISKSFFIKKLHFTVSVFPVITYVILVTMSVIATFDL